MAYLHYGTEKTISLCPSCVFRFFGGTLLTIVISSSTFDISIIIIHVHEKDYYAEPTDYQSGSAKQVIPVLVHRLLDN